MTHVICAACKRESYIPDGEDASTYNCPHCGEDELVESVICSVVGCYARTISTAAYTIPYVGVDVLAYLSMCRQHRDVDYPRKPPDAL